MRLTESPRISRRVLCTEEFPQHGSSFLVDIFEGPLLSPSLAAASRA